MPVSPQTFSRLSDVNLAHGTLLPAADAGWETERLHQGLKVILLQSGEIHCKLPAHRQLSFDAPCLCLIWNQAQHEGMQRFVPGTEIRHTQVTLPPETFSGRDIPDQLRQQPGNGPSVQSLPPSPGILSLATRLRHCDLTGPERHLFLCSKALEFAASALCILQERAEIPGPPRRPRDDAAVQRAAELLEQEIVAPPSLAEMALRVGINRRKLSAGFQRMFGQSFGEYIAALRLDRAYQMLEAGNLQVAEVAYNVGYTPAHLSVAFRKRFGISPREMRR
ncbi:helix-turn-helix transcriptional regulator [Rhodovulum sulfidophilum]|uniref:helix-turn-helix domain-containing protein n=1 Tax=Rhodovulum sulfidophilum TaxID=35806 RepID=UPI001921D330|nr:AraC family transcriptional regulator [Rhodovulum sulfidophilum]MBL3593990.1 helix-turn-helix transcriptional regulator [Rhodovulum sulfidophilum]